VDDEAASVFFSDVFSDLSLLAPEFFVDDESFRE